MPDQIHPDVLYAAYRAGLQRWLVDIDGVDELEASHWIELWERTTVVLGSERSSKIYWAAALDWMKTERAARETNGDRGRSASTRCDSRDVDRPA